MVLDAMERYAFLYEPGIVLEYTNFQVQLSNLDYKFAIVLCIAELSVVNCL